MYLKPLITTYKNELNTFFDSINLEELDQFFHILKQCEGMLFFSGVGKSGLVAQKIAVTLTSTGTRAFFLSPLEAMHGDMGLIKKDDLFISLSKSGETEEILNLIPYVRNKGAKVLSITSNAQSRIAKASDYTVTLPGDKELCPYNKAPTISTTSQLVLGDILAIGLMEHRGFTLNEFAMNHPAGTLGKRILVRVQDLMLKDKLVPLCSPSDKLIDILVELSDKRAGCVLVVDKEKTLQGIFTDGDLRRSLQKYGAETFNMKMDVLMTQAGRVIGPSALAWDALKVMEGNQKSPVMVLPVIDENRQVLGLIKMHDILQSGI